MTPGYYTITTADNGKVLGFPLPTSTGGTNNFSGASATLNVRDQNGNLYTRSLVWNPTTVEWEYSVNAGEFAAGRYWGMVAVTFPGPVGPVYSSEVIFDVIAAD
jgi:hypothetical protein